MVDFDELRAKAEGFLEEHADQVDGGIDKAAEFAAKKYGHAQEIDTGAEKLKEFLPGTGADEAEEPSRPRGAPQHGTGQPGARQAPGNQGRPGRAARPRQQGRPGPDGRRGAGRRPGPGK